MVAEVIRKLTHATPFRPYNIRMNSGEIHRVPHPDFVFISPKGSYVIVIDDREGPHHLSTFLIEEAVPVSGRVRRKARRGAG